MIPKLSMNVLGVNLLFPGTFPNVPRTMALLNQNEVSTWLALFLSAVSAGILVYQRMEKVRREEAVEWDRVRRETIQGQLDEAQQRIRAEMSKNAEMTKILGEIRLQNLELLKEIVGLNKQIIDILHCNREDCESSIRRRPDSRSKPGASGDEETMQRRPGRGGNPSQ